MAYDLQAQVSLTLLLIGPGPLSYKWKKDGLYIANLDCTKPTLTIRSFTPKHEGNYSCEVKHNEKIIESNTAKLQLSR